MTISRKRLKKIAAIKDEDIDYSDIPETDSAFWADAKFHMPLVKGKKGHVLGNDSASKHIKKSTNIPGKISSKKLTYKAKERKISLLT